MNIFAPYPDPVKSAKSLDDQRQIKMPLEAAQMLSTAVNFYGMWRHPLLKPTHGTHPCTIWVGQARDNWEWLWEHMLALDDARLARVTSKSNARNKAVQRMLDAKAWKFKNYLPYGSTPHANCARNKTLGIDFTHITDVHKAYRLYLKARWLAQDRPAVCTLRTYP